MARLIIGHTTHNSTNIWVRGSDRYPAAFVRLKGSSKDQIKSIELEERHGFTGVIRFTALSPRTNYTVSVQFAADIQADKQSRFDFGHCEGTVRTFPAKTSNVAVNFVLASCNLHSLGVFWNPDFAFTRISEEASAENADFMIH